MMGRHHGLGDVARAIFANARFEVEFAVEQLDRADTGHEGEERNFAGALELEVAATVDYVCRFDDDGWAVLVAFFEDFDLCRCGSGGHGERSDCHGRDQEQLAC